MEKPEYFLPNDWNLFFSLTLAYCFVGLRQNYGQNVGSKEGYLAWLLESLG